MNIKFAYLIVCTAVGATAVAVWISSIWLDYTINMTTSLPGTLFVIHKGGSFVKGDLVAYHWSGGATYPAGTVFIKQVTGMPGDRVKRDGDVVWVNEKCIGLAKPVSKAGIPLKPTDPGLISAGSYFVSTPSPDSLDSRYALSGNVKQAAIIGKAYAIF